MSKKNLANVTDYICLYSLLCIGLLLSIFHLEFNADGLYSFAVYYDTILNGNSFFKDWGLNPGRTYDFNAILYAIYYPLNHNLVISAFLIIITDVVAIILLSFYVINSFECSLVITKRARKLTLFLYSIGLIAASGSCSAFLPTADHLYVGGNLSILLFAVLFSLGCVVRFISRGVTWKQSVIFVIVCYVAGLFYKLFVLYQIAFVGVILLILITGKKSESQKCLRPAIIKLLGLFTITMAMQLFSWFLVGEFFETNQHYGNHGSYFIRIRDISLLLFNDVGLNSVIALFYLIATIASVVYGLMLCCKFLFLSKKPDDLINDPQRFIAICCAAIAFLFCLSSFVAIDSYSWVGFLRYQGPLIFVSIIFTSFFLAKYNLQKRIVRTVLFVLICYFVISFEKLKYFDTDISAQEVFEMKDEDYECFWKEAKNHNLNSGFAGYWTARPLMFYRKNIPDVLDLHVVQDYPISYPPFPSNINVMGWMQNMYSFVQREENIFNFVVSNEGKGMFDNIDSKFAKRVDYQHQLSEPYSPESSGVYLKPDKKFMCGRLSVYVYQNPEFDKRVKIKIKEADFIFRNNLNLENHHIKRNGLYFDNHDSLSLHGYSSLYSVTADKASVVGPYGYATINKYKMDGLFVPAGKYLLQIKYVYHGKEISDVEMVEPANLGQSLKKSGTINSEINIEDKKGYIRYEFLLKNEAKDHLDSLEIQEVNITKIK